MDGEPFWMSVIEETYPERAKELRLLRSSFGPSTKEWQNIDPLVEMLAHVLLALSETNDLLQDIRATSKER